MPFLSLIINQLMVFPNIFHVYIIFHARAHIFLLVKNFYETDTFSHMYEYTPRSPHASSPGYLCAIARPYTVGNILTKYLYYLFENINVLRVVVFGCMCGVNKNACSCAVRVYQMRICVFIHRIFFFHIVSIAMRQVYCKLI